MTTRLETAEAGGGVVLGLDDERADDPDRVGGKAAALAQASRHGLAVPDGVVIPVETTGVTADEADDRLRDVLDAVWDRLGASAPLIARSSSPVEDRADTSMAGRFESEAGIHTRDELSAAVERVLRSRDRVADEEDVTDLGVAVLVQTQKPAAASGVLFTVDPVTGNPDRVVIDAVTGDPEALVSGRAQATRYLMSKDGDELEREHGDDGADLDEDLRRRLVALGRRVEELFDAAQDVEWAVDPDGDVWLLQTRPVTDVGGDAATDRRREARDGRPVYGPGPVAETFPEPLAPLEIDLWIPPLRSALRSAFDVIGGASSSWLERSDIVTMVGGWAAVDLDLFGAAPRETAWWRRFLAFGRKFRRLAAAWRVGRVRADLDRAARAVLDAVDRRLSDVASVETLSDWQLVGLLDRTCVALESVHAHEILSGLLADEDDAQLNGASVALRVLATARREGHDDDDIVERWPVVLALAPPRIGVPQLPSTPGDLPPAPVPASDAEPAGVLREALRLRARWLQELQSRAVLELATRLREQGRIDDRDEVRSMHLDELRKVVEHAAEPAPRAVPSRLETGPPLPRAFQLRDGDVVAVTGGDEGGTGAGGGRGEGPAHLGDDPSDGDVLVVRNLDPGLAPVVDRLGGLVAETGSVLAHVAILAREAGVPTVVGANGATTRFSEGQRLRVDGDAGSVEAAGEED